MPNADAPPIIDTHLHLWDVERFHLPWLPGAGPVINRTFGLDDFDRDSTGLNVGGMVYMEVDVDPSQQEQEAAFAIELCRDPSNRVIGAVIGGSPHDEGFDKYVERFAGEDCVKGVRMVLHTPSRPSSLCREPRFVDSMKLLGSLNLSFDLCMRRGELSAGAELAAKCPKTQFVLDHCGGIGGGRVDSESWELWRQGIQAMAAEENVVCKISGIVDDGLGENWSPSQLADRVNICLDAFGEDRVLFGGDWPVCLLGGSYRSWVEALRAIVSDRSDAFRRKLFYENAVRVYGLV